MREEKLLSYLKEACPGRKHRVSGAELEKALSLSGLLGTPAQAQRSGLRGERRSDGAGKLFAARRKRASAVRDDERKLVNRLRRKGIRFSYASGLISYGSQPHDMWSDFPLILQANRRLKDVLVENQDFEQLIRHYDREDRLLSMEGKFLLSYNDDAFVRDLYDAPDIQIQSITRLNNIKQRYDPNCQFEEVFIANYDMNERGLYVPKQFKLFD